MKIAERLKEQFPSYQYQINTDTEADAAVVLCGCSAACADVTECHGIYGRFVLWKESAWEDLKAFLTSAEEEKHNEV